MPSAKSPAWQADAELLRSVPGVGPATLRAALYMAALVAGRANPVIAAHYKKLRAAGKPAKQALVACMRKLLVILDAILREQKAMANRLTHKTVAQDDDCS